MKIDWDIAKEILKHEEYLRVLRLYSEVGEDDRELIRILERDRVIYLERMKMPKNKQPRLL